MNRQSKGNVILRYDEERCEIDQVKEKINPGVTLFNHQFCYSTYLRIANDCNSCSRNIGSMKRRLAWQEEQ